jgi:septal ring factor EnvC (AmiA/AmiB activator)
MTKLRDAIATERDTLKIQVADLGEETGRLQGLIDARQKAQSEAEAQLSSERARAAELGQQATSLKDLIGRMEGEFASSRKAAAAAAAAADAQRKAAEADADSIRAKVAAGPFRDPARLQPAVPFVETKGLLPLPTVGHVIKSFGQPDGYGSSEKGLSLATSPRALVSSPADGWVAFAGPYRTYGQVLILNLGDGYYTVLAGMEHIDVAMGQFVLAGEPIGVMGDGSVKAAAAIALGAADPVLYVEFRKDGAAIDPNPWWAKAAYEKVRG